MDRETAWNIACEFMRNPGLRRHMRSFALSISGAFMTCGCCISQKGLVWRTPFFGNALNLEGDGEKSGPMDFVDVIRGLPTGDDALVMYVGPYVRIVIFCKLPEPGKRGSFASDAQTMQAWLTDRPLATLAEDPFLNIPKEARGRHALTFKMNGAATVETASHEGKEDVMRLAVDLRTGSPVPQLIPPFTENKEHRTGDTSRNYAQVYGIFRGEWVTPCKLPI